MHLRKGKGRDTVCLFYLWWADFHHFSNMKNPCMFLVPNIWRVVGGTDWAVFCMCYNLMCSSSVGCSVEGLWELEKLGSLENVHFLSITWGTCYAIQETRRWARGGRQEHRIWSSVSSLLCVRRSCFMMTAPPESFVFGVVGGMVVAFCVLGFGFRWWKKTWL